MADAAQTIDAQLIPDMLSLNFTEALNRASSLSNEMNESASLYSRPLECLQFVRKELQTPSDVNAHLRELSTEDRAKIMTQLAHAIGIMISTFKTYSQKTALQRIAASCAICEEIPVLHVIVDKVFALADLTNAPEMTV